LQLAQTGPHAHMFAQSGQATAINGDEEALHTLVHSLVISGNEATVRTRVQELLASGLDELMLLPIPIVDEPTEHQQLLHLIGCL